MSTSVEKHLPPEHSIVKMKNKKGLTPIIAVVLLLMMTVAAAGAAFFWFIRIQSELQGGSESYSGELAEKMASKVEVLAVDYSGSNEVSLYLQNKGNTEISVSRSATFPTTTWILASADGQVICQDDWSTLGSDTYCSTGCTSSMSISEVRTVVLDLTGDCSIQSSTTYPNGTVFNFIIDFSGEAGTGGRFIKK